MPSAARLRHVADIEGRQSRRLRPPPQPLDEGDELGMAVITVPAQPDGLVARPVDGQLDRAGEAAMGRAADALRRPWSRINNKTPGVAGALAVRCLRRHGQQEPPIVPADYAGSDSTFVIAGLDPAIQAVAQSFYRRPYGCPGQARA